MDGLFGLKKHPPYEIHQEIPPKIPCLQTPKKADRSCISKYSVMPWMAGKGLSSSQVLRLDCWWAGTHGFRITSWSSWWFQPPIWIIFDKLDHLPKNPKKSGWNLKNMWKRHLVMIILGGWELASPWSHNAGCILEFPNQMCVKKSALTKSEGICGFQLKGCKNYRSSIPGCNHGK